MDRFEAIKHDLHLIEIVDVDERDYVAWPSHCEWLITEVERLRRIEDAALTWAKPDGYFNGVDNLLHVIQSNPRPRS